MSDERFEAAIPQLVALLAAADELAAAADRLLFMAWGKTPEHKERVDGLSRALAAYRSASPSDGSGGGT